MAIKIIVFTLSLLLFFCFVYINANLWFRGKRSRSLITFCALGLLLSFWLLINGIVVLLDDEMISILTMFLLQTLANIVPAVLLIYVLHFVESRIVKKLWILRVVLLITLFDVLLLWTNPLHGEFIAGYDGATPIPGALIPLHLLIIYSQVALVVFFLYRYIIKNVKRKPFLALIGIGTLFPIALSVFNTFGVFDVGFDLTPFAFIFLYGTFSLYSIQTRLFDFKDTAATELFDSQSDALIVVDRTGVVTNVNPAFRRTFPDIDIIIDKTPASEVSDGIKSISLEYEQPEQMEIMFSNIAVTITGVEITVSDDDAKTYSLSKDILYYRGYYKGYIVSMTDISNYRQMIDMITELKTQADSASSAKGLFLSNMSHEIRTPLNAIIGMINIGMRAKDIERKNYCLRRADSASKHLLGIINDILDMSKIEADKYELSYGRLDIEEMMANITNVANVRAEEKRQQFFVNIGEGVPAFIEGDELRLTQVITNLVTNAIKFTPEEGTVTLNIMKVEESGNDVVLMIDVTDTGIGISQEQQSKLFSSYTQADSEISKNFGGTGLGLAISKRIVELMGGEIWIESELGTGSKFIFTIKATKLTEIQDEKSDDSQYETTGSNYDFSPYKILIAEDIEINREIMSAIFEETGISIDYAENGRIAVEKVSGNTGEYDLILMDVNMPVMDGYEATQLIRALGTEYAVAVPIIAMTAHVFKEDIERCLESGMNDHIGKPIEAYSLFGALNKYLTHTGEKIKMRDVHKLDQGIAWDDSLLTGNALVDIQRQKVFERFSDLVHSCEVGSETTNLSDIMMFLVNHTTRHLAAEEALLAEHGYPEFESHKQMHDGFRSTVSELEHRFKKNESSEELSKDVNKAIVRWLATHFRQEDKKICEYMRTVSGVQ